MSRRQLLDQPLPRRFQLYRREDVNGASGTGIVAEGIRFRDGMCAYRWLTAPSTLQVATELADIKHLHGHHGRTSVRWLDEETAADSKTVEEVYADRNRLALALSQAAIQLSTPYNTEADAYNGGWHVPYEEDDADAEKWAVAWAELPTGQVSWHVPRELVDLVDLPDRPTAYDGHSREEKNQRLLEFSKM